MENKIVYKRAMKEAGNLRDRREYDEATNLMRTSCCENLVLIDVPGVDEQGITDYYDRGDILLSSAENFGDRKNKKEFYRSWNSRTKKELQSLYRCKLTGEDCIGRTTYFHSSDIAEGDHNQVMVDISKQIKCPAFKFKKNLANMLKEKI